MIKQYQVLELVGGKWAVFEFWTERGGHVFLRASDYFYTAAEAQELADELNAKSNNS